MSVVGFADLTWPSSNWRRMWDKFLCCTTCGTAPLSLYIITDQLAKIAVLVRPRLLSLVSEGVCDLLVKTSIIGFQVWLWQRWLNLHMLMSSLDNFLGWYLCELLPSRVGRLHENWLVRALTLARFPCFRVPYASEDTGRSKDGAIALLQVAVDEGWVLTLVECARFKLWTSILSSPARIKQVT